MKADGDNDEPTMLPSVVKTKERLQAGLAERCYGLR